MGRESDDGSEKCLINSELEAEEREGREESERTLPF